MACSVTEHISTAPTCARYFSTAASESNSCSAFDRSSEGWRLLRPTFALIIEEPSECVVQIVISGQLLSVRVRKNELDVVP